MLLSDFRTVNNWFYENFMILNPGKCYFMSISDKDTCDKDIFYYDNLTLKNSNEEKILEVFIDRKLTFHQHIKKMFRKAGQKLNALQRLSPYLDTNKRKQYTLRITYNDKLTDFKSLLSNHNEITIHQGNLQVLMTEIYKIINHIVPPIM